MDDNNRRSLISKIAAKGVVTPYEAIYIQHLNNQYVSNQIPDMGRWENPYLAAEYVPQILSEYQLKPLLMFNFRNDGNLYDAYRWAASNLSHFDANITDIGYKGIALLNEIRYMRDENALRLILKEPEDDKLPDGTFLEFCAFSQVHQKNMTIAQILESFATTFHFLIMSINNILTLNYYLNGLYKIEDLRCLQYLKMWFVKEQKTSEEGSRPLVDIARFCYEQTHDLIIDRNHPDFVELMKNMLRTFNISLQPDFQDGSLQYVKQSLEKGV